MNEEYSPEERSNLPFMDVNLDIEKRIDDLLSRLTIKEKFKLSSGKKQFFTAPIKRLGIKSFKMTDGPHGIAPHSSGDFKGTYFPTGICRTATWNPELAKQFGIAVAKEVKNIGYHMILGPGVNIIRTPMCGRNFEYQTEDPYLNKEMAVTIVKGIQSQKIAACVKHFICNNQEINRFTESSEVNERTLQEIYFPAFKATVLEADAWSFMSCYNKLNGLYGSEHKNLITERLMGEWGFKGFVVSDWNATVPINNLEDCVNAGLSLEMPRAIKYKLNKMEKAYKETKFTEVQLNENIRRLLRVMFLVGLFDEKNSQPHEESDISENQELSRKIAEEGIVLLKNKDDFLPLNFNKIKKISLIGPNIDREMGMGGGSSQVKPPYEITPLKGIMNKCESKIDFIDSPSDADVVILCAGLDHEPGMDCENFDRKSFKLPLEQMELIQNTIKENAKTVVVLINGSPIDMNDWINDVPVIVEAWYGGMEAGNAIANVLFGDINPSGKLPITFPKYLSDSPAHASERTYPGDEKVHYEEGIFVGYRHFDINNIEPLFPFGYGLSYTSFSFQNLIIDKQKISGDENFKVSVEIINSGKYAGAEVVQLYIQDIESSLRRPIKELKRFKKIYLEPGESQTILFELCKEDLSYYNDQINSWVAEKGIFNILIGNSSRDIYLHGEIEYIS